MKAFPQLQTQRFQLRQFSEEDLHNVFAGLSNPEVIKYYGVKYATLEATKEQMQWFSNLEKTGKGIWWAICDMEKSTFYGACGFNDLDKEKRKAEIGFWLLPEFWGMGIIQECLPEILKYAFEELKLNRIEAFVETENLNSKKVLEKLNFQLEKTMKNCEIKDGKLISLDLLILRPQELI